MMEAVFAVTPSETIKWASFLNSRSRSLILTSASCFCPFHSLRTKLIDDAMRPNPKYPKGLIPGTAAIIKEEGISGIYRGLFPVMMRQGANSAVRFGTYSSLKNFVQGSSRPGQSLPGGVTFGIGAVAGIVTVYTTMPFDVIKTRMQSLEARTRYSNSFNCASQILKQEGITAFWRGTTPRLARLVLSGGIVFTVVSIRWYRPLDNGRTRPGIWFWFHPSLRLFVITFSVRGNHGSFECRHLGYLSFTLGTSSFPFPSIFRLLVSEALSFLYKIQVLVIRNSQAVIQTSAGCVSRQLHSLPSPTLSNIFFFRKSEKLESKVMLMWPRWPTTIVAIEAEQKYNLKEARLNLVRGRLEWGTPYK